MKRILFMIMMAFVAIGTVGCGSTNPKPTGTQLASAYYGAYPDNYQKIIQNYHSNLLFDPYSAKFKFSTPKKGWMWVKKNTPLGIDFNNSTVIGWAVIYAVNAKNRFGAYTGFSKYKAVIVDGEVLYTSPIVEQMF